MTSSRPHAVSITVHHISKDLNCILVGTIPLASTTRADTRTAHVFNVIVSVDSHRTVRRTLRHDRRHTETALVTVPSLIFHIGQSNHCLSFVASPRARGLISPRTTVNRPLRCSLPPSAPTSRIPHGCTTLHRTLTARAMRYCRRRM